MTWLPRAMQVLRDELPNIDVTVSSDESPRLADALMRGKIDAAFIRPEARKRASWTSGREWERISRF